MVNKQITKEVTISEDLFSDLVIQVGILKEIYDKITVSHDMNAFQKKVLLKNKANNIEILTEVEKVCKTL